MCSSLGNETVEIRICMGSSCFARGNNVNIGIIKDYLASRGVEARVEICGTLCQGKCRVGPNLFIDGREYNEVNPTTLPDILEDAFFRR